MTLRQLPAGPPLTRRRFLAVSAGAALLAGCTAGQAAPPNPVGPFSPRIMELEQARARPGQRIVDAVLRAAPARRGAGHHLDLRR